MGAPDAYVPRPGSAVAELRAQKWRDEMAAIEKGLIPPSLMYQTKYFLQLFFYAPAVAKATCPRPRPGAKVSH